LNPRTGSEDAEDGQQRGVGVVTFPIFRAWRGCSTVSRCS
jgi:hypothetical protein